MNTDNLTDEVATNYTPLTTRTFRQAGQTGNRELNARQGTALRAEPPYDNPLHTAASTPGF